MLPRPFQAVFSQIMPGNFFSTRNWIITRLGLLKYTGTDVRCNDLPGIRLQIFSQQHGNRIWLLTTGTGCAPYPEINTFSALRQYMVAHEIKMFGFTKK